MTPAAQEHADNARKALLDCIRACAPCAALVQVADGYAAYFVSANGRLAALDYGEADTLEEIQTGHLGGIVDHLEDRGARMEWLGSYLEMEMPADHRVIVQEVLDHMKSRTASVRP